MTIDNDTTAYYIASGILKTIKLVRSADFSPHMTIDNDTTAYYIASGILKTIKLVRIADFSPRQ